MILMKNLVKLFSLFLAALLLAYIIVYCQYESNKHSATHFEQIHKESRSFPSEIIVVSVVCGDRLNETFTMLKSAILFAFDSPLKLIIVSESKLTKMLTETLTEWQKMKSTITYEIKNLSFPAKQSNDWKTLFKPCAAQRLFLPTLLLNVDAVLYVDTDTLFMAPLSIIWDQFKQFNSTQLAGLSPEHEDPNVGWYNRFAKHPYYGKLGVNSGVMLMNLTRMRTFRWTDYMLPIYKQYKLQITWGDQDIINVLFHYHPDKLYIFSCLFNYRPDHCMYMSVCNPSTHNKTVEGVAVLHGNRGYFHTMKQPIFHSIYQAMYDYKFGSDPYKNFVSVIEKYVETNTTTNCGQVKNLFLTYSRKYITKS